MRVAIGSYCYHCYFGEAYAALQPPADRAITVWDFVPVHGRRVTKV